jgi:hypothetical protein
MTAYLIVDVTQVHDEPAYAGSISANLVVVAGVGNELPQ